MTKKLAAALLLMLVPLAAWTGPKVVVLGFDGADPALVRRYMEEGALPNIRKLSEQGCFRDLEVANPPQTPVSWGVFMTSWNPGRNEVFDFLRRDPATYKPSFALNEEGRERFLFGGFNPFFFALASFLALLGAGIAASRLTRGRGPLTAASSAVLGVFAAMAVMNFTADNVPSQVPRAINHLKGKAFWELAAEKGVKALVIRHPDTFPAKPFEKGRLLSGLGVPDMRGRIGTPLIITTDYSLKQRDNEFSVEIITVNSRVFEEFQEVELPGPYNKPFHAYPLGEYEDGCLDDGLREALRKEALRDLERRGVKEIAGFPVRLRVDASSGSCELAVGGERLKMGMAEWSDWVRVEFRLSRLVRLSGMVRFYLVEVSPELRLYMSPVQIHPENNLHISYPEEYARELFERFGPFKTMGWAVDTWTISSGLSGEEQFLSDMYETEGAYERMMAQLLKDGDCDLYVQIFEFTDRVAHVLWRHVDEGHPFHDPSVAETYAGELRKSYAYMDRIIGRAMELIPQDCVLIVLSDHGFASFRKEVNYNRWLVDRGLMTLSEGTGLMSLYDLFDDNRLLFKNVDWSRTKAYALGLGNIYVNLEGREKHGIVKPGPEYDEVVRLLKEELPSMRDPETGESPVRRVYSRDEIYSGYDPSLVPDLRVSNNPGYRVSWQTSLGGVPEKLITPNLKPWSGDHCSLDPEWVKGMFLCNRKVEGVPDIIDVAPTALSILGVEPEGMEGRVLAVGGR